MLHTHWLCELEEQLLLRMEQDKELEDELREKIDRQELDMLELLLDWSLEHLLLEEQDDNSAPDKQELEELEEWELCVELQLEEQQEVKLSDGLLQEELDDRDS